MLWSLIVAQTSFGTAIFLLHQILTKAFHMMLRTCGTSMGK